MEEKKEETNTQSEPAPKAQVDRAPGSLRALLGEKVGMTQVFTTEGHRLPVTIVRAGPCPVVRVKSADGKDGYCAVVLGFGQAPKSQNKPTAGQYKACVTPSRYMREFLVADTKGFEPGQIADVNGRFAPGDYVDVQGTSKGKGFAGVMKRHGFGGLPAAHGASDKERSPGSLAARRSIGRVLPGQRMAGRMGMETVTVQKLEVLEVDPERNLLYLSGPVPGANGSLVAVRETFKALKRRIVKPKVKRVRKDKMGNIIVETPKRKKK